jgi:glycosyltransferase involved in cell wall biosynthesis
LPAVATDVPGTREVILHEKTGRLAPVSNPTALAEAMACMMHASSEERRATGERARNLVVAQFSLEAVLDKWEALYRDLLEKNPRPGRWGGSN